MTISRILKSFKTELENDQIIYKTTYIYRNNYQYLMEKGKYKLYKKYPQL